MANIGKVLKDEIVRLSRKNAGSIGKPLKAELRSMKRQIRALTLDVKALEVIVRKGAAPKVKTEAAEAAPAGRAFTGKGIKALRRKLKITQVELARLANVSPQAVVMWERKAGKIRFRHATAESLSAIRGMRKADVKAALEAPAQ
jgi:DNA-binding transcriptional regulator YiaG